MSHFNIKILLAAGLTAFTLVLIVTPKVMTSYPSDQDILTKVLGGTAELAADAAYRQAEVYFHAGLSGGCEHVGKCEVEHHEHESMVSDLPLLNAIHHLHGETAPKEHRHIEGEEEKELLPWFETAVRLNPNHIEAWVNGSYWYYRTGNADRAEEFISKGISKNPENYKVYMERGILYFRLGRNIQASRDLKKARTLCSDDSKDMTFDKEVINRYLKHLRQGKPKNIIETS